MARPTRGNLLTCALSLAGSTAMLEPFTHVLAHLLRLRPLFRRKHSVEFRERLGAYRGHLAGERSDIAGELIDFSVRLAGFGSFLEGLLLLAKLLGDGFGRLAGRVENRLSLLFLSVR